MHTRTARDHTQSTGSWVPRHTYARVAALAGPAAGAVPLLLDNPGSFEEPAWRLLGVLAWMVLWWTTEVVPLAVTALLPIIFFPWLGIVEQEQVVTSYGHPVVFLFLGGFIIAQGLTRWDLHRRLALWTLCRIGTRPDRVILGLLCAGAFLSMWISNTATAVLLLPVAVAAAQMVEPSLDSGQTRQFSRATLLAVAYGCTIGGIGTLIGSPPNALLAAFMQREYGLEIGFAQWMAFGVPCSVIMLPLAWLWLTRFSRSIPAASGAAIRPLVESQRAQLGRLTRPEARVLVVFMATALAWLLRPLLGAQLGLPITDTSIALTGALLLFVLPSGLPGQRLLDWPHAARLPWGTLLLFGGGLAVADAIVRTELASAIAESLPLVDSRLLMVVLVSVTVLTLTELASNTAVVAAFLPVLAALAASWNQHPFTLLLPAALAGSGAFMLPVATPPNAIVFGHSAMNIRVMMRSGLVLNLLSLGVILLAMTLLAPWVFDIGSGVTTPWAKGR